MKSAIASITALLVSVFILFAGSGLQVTLVPLAASAHGFDPLAVGLIGSSYFLGMAVGCFVAPWLIRRTGHIRAFAACTALATAASLVHAIAIEPFTWNVLRFTSGLCFAVLYAVIESWLNDKSDNTFRGSVLAVYNVINFAGMATGQQFLRLFPAGGFQLFSLSAVLISIAAIPVALTRSTSPQVPVSPRLRLRWLLRLSPVSVAGAFTVGLANGAFWTVGPVYASMRGLDSAGVGTFITASLIGAMAMLWPAGRLSDRVDRRLVIAGCCILSAAAGIGLAIAGTDAVWTMYLAALLFGAGAMPIYSLSSAHAADFATSDDMVAVATGLLLVYTFGAIIGPAAAATMISTLTAGSMFVMTTTAHLLLAVLAIHRLRRREALPPEARDPFVALPRTSPVVAELDPRHHTEDEEPGPEEDVAPASETR